MKLMKRTKIYKASNVTFNPETKQAYSYGWWRFVDVIEGKVVFNSYRYSNTTAWHQYKVRCLMEELGIKIDLEVSTSSSLSSANGCLEELENLVLETLNETEFHALELRNRRNERARQRRLEIKEAVERVVQAASHETQEIHMATVLQFRRA